MFTLRRAVAADEPQLLAMTPRLAAFPLPAWRDGSQIAAADHPILTAALRAAGNDHVIVVAETATGQLAGCVFATTKTDYFTGRPHAHVEVLAVAPHAEGHGLGRRLMAAAEAWAREQGHDHVTLNVFETNRRARGLYETLGYQPELVRYRKGLTETP